MSAYTWMPFGQTPGSWASGWEWLLSPAFQPALNLAIVLDSDVIPLHPVSPTALAYDFPWDVENNDALLWVDNV